MRLPTTSRTQKLREDSRQFHEALYQAFLDGRRVNIIVSPHTIAAEQLRISGNARKFWADRGFQIRTQAQAGQTVLAIWIAVKDAVAA